MIILKVYSKPPQHPSFRARHVSYQVLSKYLICRLVVLQVTIGCPCLRPGTGLMSAHYWTQQQKLLFGFYWLHLSKFHSYIRQLGVERQRMPLAILEWKLTSV